MLAIAGLFYIPDYVDERAEATLVRQIDQQTWRTDLSRRTQHYGYVYDYRARTVDPSMYLGELPPWLEQLAVRLCDEGRMPQKPDQAIINEYLPGEGIADHIDCTPCFGDVIASLSLAGSVVMNFKRDNLVESLFLERRSLLVLRGEARYAWTHGIARRKSDELNGRRLKRHRRLSVTFRKVMLSGD